MNNYKINYVINANDDDDELTLDELIDLITSVA